MIENNVRDFWKYESKEIDRSGSILHMLQKGKALWKYNGNSQIFSH